jgi:hypothetical protein
MLCKGQKQGVRLGIVMKDKNTALSTYTYLVTGNGPLRLKDQCFGSSAASWSASCFSRGRTSYCRAAHISTKM